MESSPGIPFSGQMPLSMGGFTETGASDVMCNLSSTYEDELLNVENPTTIYEEVHNSNSSSTSDVSFAVLECPPFMVDSTANIPLEARVNENFDTDIDRDLKEQPDLLELSTFLFDKVLPCDKSGISVNSIPILDQTPVILNDIATPDISKCSVSSYTLAESELFSKSESTEKVLLDAGYTIPEVKDIMASKRKHEVKVKVKLMGIIDHKLKSSLMVRFTPMRS